MLKKYIQDDDLDAAFKAILIILACIACYGLWMLAELLWFEMQPIHHGWDGLIYTAVGRGIVNGLLPYQDLFEFKPPGIFLISAASLWLLDNNWLGNILQGLCYLLILGFLAAEPLRHVYENRRKLQGTDLLPLLGSTLLGLLSLFYLAARAGQFQTESFASVFAVAFLFVIARKRHMTIVRWIIASVLLACAIGMKESFLLIIVAASLVMFPIRQIYHRLLLSLVFSVIIGTMALWMFGYLNPYLTIYLPETLIGRASFNPYPIWVLAFDAYFAGANLWAFSPAFFISLLFFWIFSLLRMADAWKGRALTAMLVLLASFALLYAMSARIVMDAQGRQLSFDQIPLPTDPLFLPLLLVFIFYGVCAWFALRFFFEKKQTMRFLGAFGQHIGAVLLSVIAILVGGMLQQQFGAFIPLFAALIFSCTHTLFSEKKNISFPSSLFVAAAMLAAVGILLLPSRDYPSLLRDQKQAQEIGVQQAEQIDGLMTACGYDRYVIFGQPNVPYGFTHHSPFGPAFTRTSFTFPVKWRKPPIPYLQNTYRAHLLEAQFLIARTVSVNGGPMIDSTDIPDDVWQAFQNLYTDVPPPCAEGFVPGSDMTFRFRKLSQ